MRRVMKTMMLCAVVALVSAPVAARAEGYVSPWTGVNFGVDDNLRSCGLNDCGQGWSWGVTGGWMGAGIIGGEVEFGYAPNYFGDFVNNHVWDLMGNLIVGVPVGGTHGAGIRPYVTGGLGAIHTDMDAIGSVAKVSDNDFGYNLGAGAMGYFSDHVGLRGDVRYLRTLNSNSGNNAVSVGLGPFHFWRASVGVVIR